MSPVTRRVGRRFLSALASVALAAGGATALSSAPASASQPGGALDSARLSAKAKPQIALPPAGRYIVTMTDEPESAYDGHLAGYPATRPQAGHSFKTDAATLRYRGYLQSRQSQVLASVGSPDTIYRYTTALSGFSADLSGEQVVALRKLPSVLSVRAEKLVKVDTVQTPAFLGLSGRHGQWAQHGGPAKAGKNIVIGDIDTGIWPENPSFAGSPKVPDVRGFDGICQAGQRWKRSTCNSKIISARYFVKGIGIPNLSPDEYLSPRDGAGHGSHTASTAAGDHGVRVHIEGQDFGKASGMAPAAYLAVYKACWEAADEMLTGCYTSDTLSAINKAVQDGVDVINYSISGTSDDFADPIEVAFLGAASAGIFVSASAGNSGPTPKTVAHPSPWVTTVAASSHILYQGRVRLGDGTSYAGAMISDKAVSKRRIILASDAGKPGADPTEVSLCYLGTLDPDKVTDRIVVCNRGVNDRVEKSAAVKLAGGVGMVLVNTTPTDTDADFHSVPTVHLDYAAGVKVTDYVEAEGRHARASIDPDGHDRTPVPQIAGFSSRGPLIAGGGDILKPDISAPGVDVIAAVAPPFNSGHRWDIYSGTSMAAPHITGLAAFIKRLRPEWTPAIIKSAMMTSAYNLEGLHSPFAQGAGHVNPRKFLDPGLAYDAGAATWLNFLHGNRKASNVNQASIAIGDLVGTERIPRMVTNVSSEKETYTATVQGVDGVDVDVEPAKITLAPGKVKKFTATFTVTDDARFKKYTTGTLVWRGSNGHVVRSPLVVRPVAISTADEVVIPTNTSSGTKRIHGKAGFTGPLDLAVVGLDGAVPVQGEVDQGDFVPVDSVTVPAGTSVARFDLDADDDADDLDLYIAVGDTIVATSATGSADEQVTLRKPAAGTYDVYVNGYSDASGGGIAFAATSWVVPPGDQGNLTVTPDPVPVTAGRRFAYDADWTGLGLDRRWFGYVKYVGRATRTYITIN